MQKVTPYLANGFPRTCWSCGKPFVIRGGHAEAIVGHDDQLYCHRIGCEEVALVPHILAQTPYLQQAALR